MNNTSTFDLMSPTTYDSKEYYYPYKVTLCFSKIKEYYKVVINPNHEKRKELYYKFNNKISKS